MNPFVLSFTIYLDTVEAESSQRRLLVSLQLRWWLFNRTLVGSRSQNERESRSAFESALRELLEPDLCKALVHVVAHRVVIIVT